MTRLIFGRGLLVDIGLVGEDDAPALARWMNKRSVIRFLGAVRKPASLASEREWIAEISKKPDEVIFGITTKAGELIGMMGLHRISHIDGTATTGAFIGEEENWNKGYGTDAKMLVLHYAFTELNLRKINSRVLAFNERSYAYLLKTGYEVEGVRKEQLFKEGAYVDEIMLAVFKKNFMRLWRAYEKKLQKTTSIRTKKPRRK